MVTRGPYLQRGTSNEVVVRWRTDLPTDSRVSYGTQQGNLTAMEEDFVLDTEHDVTLDGLSADTTYYYAIGTTTGVLAGGVVSGTEAYYSFDYGNIHFVVLDSFRSNRSGRERDADLARGRSRRDESAVDHRLLAPPALEIYRSTSPISLVAPANLYKTTSSCTDTDQNASPFNILFYSVIE